MIAVTTNIRPRLKASPKQESAGLRCEEPKSSKVWAILIPELRQPIKSNPKLRILVGRIPWLIPPFLGWHGLFGRYNLLKHICSNWATWCVLFSHPRDGCSPGYEWISRYLQVMNPQGCWSYERFFSNMVPKTVLLFYQYFWGGVPDKSGRTNPQTCESVS